MSVTKPTSSTFTAAGTKYDTASANNYYMEPIATTLVGSGGASSITFSNIPQGYTHLQVRASFTSSDSVYCSINNDTTSTNYYGHWLYGSGASVVAGANQNRWFSHEVSTNSSYPDGLIADFLDYTNQNKYKTVRILTGWDGNGSGQIEFASMLWMNTSPITSLLISPASGAGFTQYSRFSLYGLRA